MLPLQLIPESEKTQEWCKLNVDSLLRLLVSSGDTKTKESLCYEIYHGSQKEGDFEYLTGSDEYRLPTRIRFLPVIKPLFELLKATLETRPFRPTVYTVDDNSLQEKNNELSRMLLGKILFDMEDKQSKLEMARQQLQAQVQSMQQAGQEQQDPQVQMKLQAMMMQVESMDRLLSRSSDSLAEELQEAEREYSMTARTRLEVTMQRALEYLVRKYDWNDMFIQGFEDLMVVDNEFYCIDDVLLDRDPSVRRVSPLDLFYLSDQSARWIDECPAVVERRMMTPSQVLDTYGHEMSPKDINKIKDRSGSYFLNGLVPSNQLLGMNAMPSGDTSECGINNGLYAGSGYFSSDLVPVYVCQWKSVREVLYEEDGGSLSLVSEDGTEPSGKRYRRYISEWWGGVRIGSDIYVALRKNPFQFRDVKKIGKAYGRYIGFAYNGIDRRPYSRVWAIKDVQILYNIVHLHMEALMALGNVKGIVVDKSQKPADMDMEQWLYYMKANGMLFIDPTQANNSGRPSSYNQWQTYDLNFGQSIQQFLGLLTYLEQLSGRIIGIPPQRLGEVMTQDQVGTHKQAIAQSSLTTETLYYKHDQVVSRVLDRVIHSLPYAWRNGKRGSYVSGTIGQAMFNLQKNELDGVSFELFNDRFDRNRQKLDQALQAISMGFQSGTVGLSQLIESYSMENIRQLQENVKSYEKRARSIAEAQQQNAAEAEKELEQLRTDMELQVKKQLTDGEQLKAQLEEVRMQLDERLAGMEAEADMQMNQLDNETRRYVADQNTLVESAYVEQIDKKIDVEARLRVLEAAMNLKGKQGISSPRPKNRVRD